MPNFATSVALVDTATKCRATAFGSRSARRVQSRAAWALASVSWVVKVLEETTKSVSAGSRSRVASTKSVPSTLETKRSVRRAVAVVPQRLVGHDRAQVGAADADVDHVADGLPGEAGPGPAAHAGGEVGHAVEHRVHAGHHVLAVHQDARPPGRAQRHVEHRALLGHVDLLAREHGVDARPQAGRLGQREQEPQGLVGDPVLRVVEVE